ncbi:hypothetical protein GOP47_0001795 [Adiantum capillus-veneris]|uniref:Uncharacterized protein n=1 Tax=Adiantum capillus-veneris TaxID=13818 RepID=A0A9D4V9H9_ADICA|nr:hypothetical protein GOP47_0001795 [Adiantum capillus-veneris]
MEESDPHSVLSKAWYNLRLSIRCPERVPTWDAILLTAASPQQAHLYQWHLDLAKLRGTIASHTIALAVPDPGGVRIGSGGATLHALRSLVHFSTTSDFVPATSSRTQALNTENISSMRVLLVHAGGDSKRVPWANPIGKAFLPLPSLHNDDPNKQASTLFDHILAISSYVPQDFGEQGGLLIMTGDVLPCYDFSCLSTPINGTCIVVVPAPPDVAANHGVILTRPGDDSGEGYEASGQRCELHQVIDLLQKPSHSELSVRGALSEDNTALLDSGIFAVRGRAWTQFLNLSVEDPDLISKLLEQREEVSLYEEIAAAWVPSRHEWLRSRPLGIELLKALSSHCLFSYCARNLHFLHFGTSVEVLSHLAKYIGGNNMQRTLTLTADNQVTEVAPSAVIISSDISSMVYVGDQSLVCNCTLTNGVRVGSKCIVLGINLGTLSGEMQGPLLLSVPDQHCLWEVPLLDSECRVTLCCSIHDNPKVALSKMGTFCGKQWKDVFDELGVDEEDIWPEKAFGEERKLWNASLFPVASPGKGIAFAMWLMGTHPEMSRLKVEWQRCKRMNLAELHGCIDFQKLCNERKVHQAKVCLRLAEASVRCGSLHQDLPKLCREIVEGLSSGREACKDLQSLYLDLNLDDFKVPHSRVYQAGIDLSNASGDSAAVATYEKKVWEAVAAETAMAIGHNEVTHGMHKQLYCIFRVSRVKVELPARIDFAGGWSDTPPWSLEQSGTVLNMAVLIDGCAPIGVELEVTSAIGVCISDDGGHHTYIKDPAMLGPPYEHDDPFRLVKSALVVTGLVGSSALQCAGLAIRTWANVPRGSGLGTSSILAAAVVKAIRQAVGADDSNEIITSLVLFLEQLMGTGGGWQDQVGGLYPGVKCTSGFPGSKLLLKVEPILITPQIQSELENRLVVFFTGQVSCL